MRPVTFFPAAPLLPCRQGPGSPKKIRGDPVWFSGPAEPGEVLKKYGEILFGSPARLNPETFSRIRTVHHNRTVS
jgi:hypothetical protein